MFAASVNMKFTIHLSAKLGLWKHAADCMFNNPYRLFTKSIASFLVSVTTDVTGVVEVNFLQFFLACQNDFICVDDDNIVTSINMRCIGRFIFAGQNLCNVSSKTANGQSFSIYDIPLRVMLPALAINVVFIINDSS